MTGGNIFLAVANNEEFQEMARNDKMFSNTIQALSVAADNGDQELANFIINMVYGFQNLYTSIILTVMKCGDELTINSINSLFAKSLDDNSLRSCKQKVEQDAEDGIISKHAAKIIIDEIDKMNLE